MSHKLVQMAIRGHARTRGSDADKRLPITPEILEHIFRRLPTVTKSVFDSQMFRSACSLAFSAFLRVSEFTCSSAACHHKKCLMFSSIEVTDSKLSVLLSRSKSNQFGPGQRLLISRSSSGICPVREFKKYSRLRRMSMPVSRPAYVLSDGSYLTPSTFNRVVKSCLQGMPEAHRYSSHSFRIGAASTARVQGVPLDAIQDAGRWKSDAFRRYLRLPTRCPALL